MGHYGSFVVYGPPICYTGDEVIEQMTYLTLIYKYLSQRDDIEYLEDCEDDVNEMLEEFETFMDENDISKPECYDYESVSRVWKEIFSKDDDPSVSYAFTAVGSPSLRLMVSETESVYMRLIYEDGFIEMSEGKMTLCICLAQDYAADDYFEETYPDILNAKFNDEPDSRLTAFKTLINDLNSKTKMPPVSIAVISYSVS